jgi:pantoate--beta-alanine ligase
MPASANGRPRVITDPLEMRAVVNESRSAGRRVGLVPTMGALHQGHLSLVRAATDQCDATVVTIFVNPTQFGPGEDLASYPRDLDRDLDLLAPTGADLVFAPQAGVMYPPEHETYVEVGPTAEPLEGAHRPGHFRGVATIVLKLFQMVPADAAFFGRKDYQQTLVVERMVADLNLDIEIRVCPIVREPDGLAMSSRNVYLSPAERTSALAISQSLQLAEREVAAGNRGAADIERRVRRHLTSTGGVDVEYVALVAAGTVTPVSTIDQPTVLAIAARVGATRLIDNCELRPEA